jgi:hypothetical protein
VSYCTVVVSGVPCRVCVCVLLAARSTRVGLVTNDEDLIQRFGIVGHCRPNVRGLKYFFRRNGGESDGVREEIDVTILEQDRVDGPGVIVMPEEDDGSPELGAADDGASTPAAAEGSKGRKQFRWQVPSDWGETTERYGCLVSICKCDGRDVAAAVSVLGAVCCERRLLRCGLCAAVRETGVFDNDAVDTLQRGEAVAAFKTVAGALSGGRDSSRTCLRGVLFCHIPFAW